MNLHPLINRLKSISQPEPTIVTLTLDLAGSGITAEASRLFLRDRALRWRAAEEHPAEARGRFEKLGDRIRTYVESELRPETDGLYLVAGSDLWEPVELKFPMPNLFHVDHAPYLPPLLNAIDLAPR